MAVLGLMNTLVLEGASKNIHVNALAPTAATRMTDDIMPEEFLALLGPESVTAGLLTLCHEDSPTKQILCAGGGGYASTRLFETDGVFLPPEQQSPEEVLKVWDKINDTSNQATLETGPKQPEKFLKKAAASMRSD